MSQRTDTLKIMSIAREIGKSIPNHAYLFSYVVCKLFAFYLSYNCENEPFNIGILN